MTLKEIDEIQITTNTSASRVSLTLARQRIRTDRWETHAIVYDACFNDKGELTGACRYMDLLFDLKWNNKDQIWEQDGKEHAVERKYTRDAKLNRIEYITEPIPPTEYVEV